VKEFSEKADFSYMKTFVIGSFTTLLISIAVAETVK
jgi:hypothetical protein